MDSGYGDEESYNVYDKPWREGGSLGAHIYRPSRNLDKDVYGDDLDKLIKTNRYYSCSFTMGIFKLQWEIILLLLICFMWNTNDNSRFADFLFYEKY